MSHEPARRSATPRPPRPIRPAHRRARRTGTMLLLLGTALAGCGGDGTGPDAQNPDGSGSPGSARPYTMTGRVLDAREQPLGGAEIVADNQLLYDSNVVGLSGGDGRYALALPAIGVTWAGWASITRTYNGHAYVFELAPSDESPFAGNSGAVRDFTWRVSGERADGRWWGSPVLVNRSLENLDLAAEDVELTLEPVGPLIDGTSGGTITDHPVPTPDGDAIVDVPIGRYRITAREAPPGGTPRTLLVRPTGVGDYADELIADFTPLGDVWDLGIYHIRVEVRRP